VKTWTRDEWQTRRDAHLARVEVLAHAFLRRRSRGEKHPVEDFLFTYYQLPPTRLIEWFPPLHTAIEVRADDLESMPWLQNAPHLLRDGLWSLDPAQVTPRIRELAAWIADNGAITAANYERFCSEVENIGESVALTGSAQMIELCDALVTAGAGTVRL
jgi:hypothetical protein